MPILLAIGAAQALFSIIFILNRRPLRTVHIIVSLFLLFLAMPMLSQLVRMGILNIPFPEFLLRIKSYPLAFGPFLYLYALHIVGGRFGFKAKYLIHFVPFLVFAVLFMSGVEGPAFHGPPPAHPGLTDLNETTSLHGRHMGRGRMMDDGFHLPHYRREASTFRKIHGLTTLGSFVFYTILLLLLLRKHGKEVADYFSYMSMKVRLRWLQWSTIGFVMAYLFVFMSEIIIPNFTMPLFPPRLSHVAGLTFFIYIFSFFAMQQETIFDISEGGTGIPADEKLDRRYERSGLKNEDAERYLQALESYMRTERPYQEGDLTIMDVAEHLQIPRHYLTQVINEKLEKNFYTYVNEYRMEEVKAKLSDETFREHSLLRIALDAGFNSKSSFNRIFKSFTGMTPTDFRKSLNT